MGIDEHSAYAERGLQQALYGVPGEPNLLHHLCLRKSVVTISKQLQYAELKHEPCGLKHDWPPCDELSLPLSLAGRELLGGISFFYVRKEMHYFISLFDDLQLIIYLSF